jgi:hypothetical protein
VTRMLHIFRMSFCVSSGFRGLPDEGSRVARASG